MLSVLERKIAEAIAGSQLATRDEIKRSLQLNGSSISDALDSILHRLVEKEVLITIRPMGSTCYIITKKGNQLLHEQ